MRKTVWIMSALVVAVAAGGYGWFGGERTIPIRYRTAPVERGSVVKVVTATGAVAPVVAVPVGSQVSGMIERLDADFNSIVKAGDVVARLDAAPFRKRQEQAAANLAMAKAMVAKARADLAQRKRELERLQGLLAQQFVSQNEVDVAVTAYEGALAQQEVNEAQVKQADAGLHAAELDLSYTVIRSPVNGVVIARNVEIGQTVAASFATPNLFLIAYDLARMQVDTNVSEADIGGLTEGKEATFTVDAYPGERFHGQVRQVRNAPVSVQNVVTYDVVIEVENRDLRLKPGMTANVSVVVDRRDQVLTVPAAALRFSHLNPIMPGRRVECVGTPTHRQCLFNEGRGIERARAKVVWRVGPSGDPEAVPIQPGVSDGNVTEVVGGALKEGDAVIVGIDTPQGARKANALPPGFGGGPSRPGSPGRGL